MSLKKIALLQPRKDLNREQFERYWREVHGPLVSQAPGYLQYRLRYIQNQWLPVGPQGLPPTWAGVAEFWLPADNEDEFATTAIYQQRIRPDEARFIDFDGTVSMTAREIVIQEGKAPIKLWLVSPQRPDTARAETRARTWVATARSGGPQQAVRLIRGWEINQVLPGSFRLPGAVTTADLDWALIQILRFDSLSELEQALAAGLLPELASKGLHDVADVSFVTLERRFFDGVPLAPVQA
jgi:uncharacterized protein (TIGR02118 family)